MYFVRGNVSAYNSGKTSLQKKTNTLLLMENVIISLQNLAVQSLEGIAENLSQSESLLEKLYIPLTYGVMVLYQMNLKTSFQMKQNL